MRVFLMITVAAISLSGAAFAEEAATGPSAAATAPAAMSDAEMDRVTAAGGPPDSKGAGIGTADQVAGQPFPIADELPNGVTPREGTNTAGTTPGLSPSPLP